MVPLSSNIALAAQGLHSGPLLRPRACLAALVRTGPVSHSCNQYLLRNHCPLPLQQRPPAASVLTRRHQRDLSSLTGYSSPASSIFSCSSGPSTVATAADSRPAASSAFSSRASPSASSNVPSAAAASSAGTAVTAPPMAPASADAAQQRQFTGSQRYEAPEWAQGLKPVPESRLALGHVRYPSSIPSSTLQCSPSRLASSKDSQHSRNKKKSERFSIPEVDSHADAFFPFLSSFVLLLLLQLPTPIHRWNIPGLPKGTNLLIKVGREYCDTVSWGHYHTAML